MQKYEIVSVPNCSLWTTHQGNGPALVCCHGGPGLWDYLAPVAEMADDLMTVYRYDQRACSVYILDRVSITEMCLSARMEFEF